MQFLQSPIGQRLAITLLALAVLVTSRFVPDFKEMLGMAASAMFAWAWLKRPGDDAAERPTKPKADKRDDDDPPPTPRSGPPSIPLAAACFLLFVSGCAGMSRGERVRYGLDAIRATCKLAGVYPADVPADIKPELEPVCLALGSAKAEAVEESAPSPEPIPTPRAE